MRAPFLVGRQPPSCCVLARESERASSGVFFLTRVPVPSRGLPLMTSPHPNRLPKASSSPASTLALRASSCKFLGDTDVQPSIRLCGNRPPTSPDVTCYPVISLNNTPDPTPCPPDTLHGWICTDCVSPLPPLSCCLNVGSVFLVAVTAGSVQCHVALLEVVALW